MKYDVRQNVSFATSAPTTAPMMPTLATIVVP